MQWTPEVCDLLRDVAKQRPQVGDIAIVTDGQKHYGVRGRITWHGVDRFASSRYLDNMMRHMRDCMGTSGFRVQIAPEDGSESFFVGADKIDIPARGVMSWASRRSKEKASETI